MVFVFFWLQGMSDCSQLGDQASPCSPIGKAKVLTTVDREGSLSCLCSQNYNGGGVHMYSYSKLFCMQWDTVSEYCQEPLQPPSTPALETEYWVGCPYLRGSSWPKNIEPTSLACALAGGFLPFSTKLGSQRQYWDFNLANLCFYFICISLPP